MSNEFIREARYVVLKSADVMKCLTVSDLIELRRIQAKVEEHRAEIGKPPLDCVVVESDWPEYEPTWKAIEARVTGAQPAPSLASDDVSLISEGNTQLAPCVKDAIIDDLQSQFDTEGITEHDSGDALIRLSDAIAAVEDNFAQPAPSVPEGWQLVPTAESRHPGIYKMLGALHAANNTPGMSEWESYRAMLSEAPEVKP